MTIDCTEIVSQHLAFSKEGFEIDSHADGCIIVTPFERPDGDLIEILVEARGENGFTLTDMGDTLAYLYLNGMSLNSRFMQDVRRISQKFNSSVNVNEIRIDVEGFELGPSLHELIQAAIHVSALIEKRRPYSRLRFEEEVEATIIAQGRSYDLQYSVLGQRASHTVRFHINSGLNLLAHTFSQAREAAAISLVERWYYHFHDILTANPNWKIYALLDDRGDRQAIWQNPDVTVPIEGLVTMVKWSERSTFIDAIKVDGHA